MSDGKTGRMTVRIHAQGCIRIISSESDFITLHTACHVVEYLRREGIPYRAEITREAGK